jgi:hypothetical integral membrane protein (TIGR02206 family)
MVIFSILAVLICGYARKHLNRQQQKRILLIATIIPMAAVVSLIVIKLALGTFNIQEDLPIHICRIVAVMAPWVYLREKPLWTGICYFWVLVGTVNATLTPDLYSDFPHWEYFNYFGLHLGLIFLPIYYVVVLGHRISLKDLWNAIIASNIFVILSLIINKVLGSNYMFTMRKPEASTILDYLGPWPIYLLSVEALGIALFFVVYLPFWWRKRTNYNPQAKLQQTHKSKL